MTIAIRPARPTDIPAITRIYSHAVEHGTASFELSPPDEAEMARRMNDRALGVANDRRGSVTRTQSTETRALEEEFTRAVEMKVRLQRTTRGKGQITLYFTNDQQLETLYSRLVGAARAGQNGHDAYALLDGSEPLSLSYDDLAEDEDDLIEDDEDDADE